VPRAKPFPDSEEEEKTTIESQWEDEASTTVEQGEVADKIRALGAEPRTQTGALEEPTVDDQHAHMSAITPLRDVARLQITAGNDAGQEIEIRPGKTYTIGRAIDNDVVLTDIAVSRKHFDLRFEDGAWVIVDRGSGNGTVVNGNLEDNPFMLANGDAIEIGNTVFRFDQPNAASRPQPTMDLDEEELSTVAGKPMRNDDIIAPIPAPMPRPQRPKTLPPPTPLRSGAASQPPPLGYPPPGPIPQPASTMPMAQMANRPPLGVPLPGLPGMSPPGAPTMLGDQHGMPLHNQLQTTIPGQGAPPQRMYPYPQATEIPPHSVHAQMLLIQTQNRRGDGSTAHVPPVPYDMQVALQQRYSQPQLTKKAKLVLAGIGLAVFAAVMTVAIVKSSSRPKAAVADKQKLDAKKTAAKMAATADATKTQPPKMVTTPTPTPANPSTATTPPVKTTTAPASTPPAKTATTTTTPPPNATAATPPTTTKTTPPTTTAKTEPAKTTPTVTKAEPVKTVPPTVTKAEPAKTTPAVAKAEPAKTTPTPTKTTTPKTESVKTAKVEPKKRNSDRRTEARRVETPAPTAEPVVKRPAGDPDAARAEAERLYKQRKFNEASSYLSNQAKKFDESDARELRRTAEYYSKLGKALATASAPAMRPTVAYESLRSAQTYDRNLANEFDGEIQTKLAQVAPRAALSYIAQKNYPAARSTMIFLKQFPSAAETVNLVKQKLEAGAGELYAEAVAELGSNPSGAREKLKLIMTIVDSTSSWYKKATQKLSGG
jgi:hypothetical protein